MISILYKPAQKTEQEGTLPKSVNRPSITLTPKPNTLQEKSKENCPPEHRYKNLIKILAK